MFSFEGDFRQRPQQSLGGSSRKENRDDLLQRAAVERQKREESRRKTNGAITIQSFIRGVLIRIKQRQYERISFDRQRLTVQQGFVDEPTLENLLRSFIFFYRKSDDTSRLLWVCQLLLRQPDLLASLGCSENKVWIYRLKKLLHISLNYLVIIAPTNSPIALPMRILEVYTSPETYGHACNKEQALLLLVKIFSFLIQNDFFKQMYTLVNNKVPCSLEKSPNPPTPLSGSIFDILVKPLDLVKIAQDPFYRNLTLKSLCEEFLNKPHTEQVSGFILPALALGKHEFPFPSLLQALLVSCPMTGQPMLCLRPTPWLLYSTLQLISTHSANCSSDMMVRYLVILQFLSPAIHVVENSKETDSASDSEDDDGPSLLQNSTVLIELRQIVEESVHLLNEDWHVNLILAAVHQEGSIRSVKILSRICYDLLIHHHQPVGTYRLLSTLAFKPEFLKNLWQIIVASTTHPVMGSKTLLLQMLARGLHLTLSEREEFVPLLALFCALCSELLQTLHDSEFYDKTGLSQSSIGSPFRLLDLVSMSLALRDVCLGLIEFAYPDTRPSVREDYRQAVSDTTLTAPSISSHTAINEAKSWSHLFKLVVALVRQLHARDSRLTFCPKDHWISKQVNIPVEKYSQLNFRRGRMSRYRPFYGPRMFIREKFVEEGPPLMTSELRNITILRELPFVVPFTDRVLILQQLITKDKTENQGEIANFLSGPQIHVMIRRNYIYEDALEKLSPENENNMKLKMRVQLVNAVGLDEAGIDGGGIFREFLNELLKTAFDPNRGFFKMTYDNLLYPNPNVHLLVDNVYRHYYFIGRMLGKALYENMLVELPLASFFLSKILGRNAGDVAIHHLDSMDPVLYRNLLYLKHYTGDVSELGLDFTVTNSELGETHVVELRSNGANIPVTNENRIKYIHLVADYKLNRQIRTQCDAFKSGLSDLINLEWLRMFDARELQVLISGASVPVDIQDLKQHTNYAGGYTPDHPVIKMFWKVVENMDDPQRKQLLKFITSCSRPPLLGFKELYPALCIQNAGPDDRLPTASTCMNLLKLPEFPDEVTLKTKLLYAVESCSGFELS